MVSALSATRTFRASTSAPPVNCWPLARPTVQLVYWMRSRSRYASVQLRCHFLMWMQPVVTILRAHEFPATTIRFNPTSSLLVSGSADDSVRVVAIPDEHGSSSASYFRQRVFRLTVLRRHRILDTARCRHSRAVDRTSRACHFQGAVAAHTLEPSIPNCKRGHLCYYTTYYAYRLELCCLFYMSTQAKISASCGKVSRSRPPPRAAALAVRGR